jgi:hypothetical protein
MPEAMEIYGSALKNGSATLLARIVGPNGANIVQADIATAKYTVYLLDDRDPDQRAPVTGHTDVALTVANVVFDSLQREAIWTADASGYNFCHVLDVSANPAFAIAGRRYLVEYRLMPVVGQVIVARFRINIL